MTGVVYRGLGSPSHVYNWDTSVPRNLEWARVEGITLAWTSMDDTATEALRSSAETAYATDLSGYLAASSGQPGAGLLYMLALEAAVAAFIEANVDV